MHYSCPCEAASAAHVHHVLCSVWLSFKRAGVSWWNSTLTAELANNTRITRCIMKPGVACCKLRWGLNTIRQSHFGLSPLLVQEICETWKLRTPNDWEPVQWWSQLLSWRNQVRPAEVLLGVPHGLSETDQCKLWMPYDTRRSTT